MMKPHEKRVVDEKQELDERLDKLRVFLCDNAFLALNMIDRDLLEDQYIAMVKYSRALRRRIARF